MKKSLHSAILIVLAMAFACPAWAAVSGTCANCHTMHNSQGGSSMALGDPSPDAGFPSLLMNDCVGCHTSATDWQDPVTGAPIVYNTTEPSTYLAGGNFYWVKTDDAKGHNVFADNPEDTLDKAPGDVGFSACMSGCCHANIHEDVTYTGQIRQGCTKCHMMSTAGDQKGYHHADDSNLVVGSSVGDTDGYYRFLSGHYSGEGHGVCGIEDSDWRTHWPPESCMWKFPWHPQQ